MILADKIINERKKNGWSQEELAEMLSVSRQSVSKWESAQAVPDLNRIIKMAEIFSVSTDYLLKDEIESSSGEENTERNDSENNTVTRKVSLEEATRYINIVKKNTPSAVIATMLFTVCPVALIELAGLSDAFEELLPVNIAALAGLIVLFLCVAAGVVIWLGVEAKEKEFNFLKYDDFETLYGIDGMVKERKKEFEGKRLPLVILAISLFILSPVGILTSALLEADALIIISMVNLLLIMVAAGVGIFIYTSRISGIYENLLKEGRISPAQKKAARIKSKISGAYWCIVAAVFLVFGLGYGKWEVAGILFPVAGVLYAAAIGIVKIFLSNDD
ncbi:MAG: helix-turn-helix domain-containing protein [Lachnospiraceae bacterium]|nr:helix-turn-helix domain-containing protein [Lachnospiraceae bacterium]